MFCNTLWDIHNKTQAYVLAISLINMKPDFNISNSSIIRLERSMCKPAPDDKNLLTTKMHLNVINYTPGYSLLNEARYFNTVGRGAMELIGPSISTHRPITLFEHWSEVCLFKRDWKWKYLPPSIFGIKRLKGVESEREIESEEEREGERGGRQREGERETQLRLGL